MEDQTQETTPDPLETVVVLRSDLELQNQAMELAVNDITVIAAELGIVLGTGEAPAELVPQIVHRIRQLKQTQRHVDEAASELRKRAAALGNQTIELEGGQKGLLVGKRLPGGLPGLDTMTRAERRRFERERRR